MAWEGVSAAERAGRAESVGVCERVRRQSALSVLLALVLGPVLEDNPRSALGVSRNRVEQQWRKKTAYLQVLICSSSSALPLPLA